MQKMTLKTSIKTRRFIAEHYNNCTMCGIHFRVNETTHLGHNIDNKLIYVGDCCSAYLKDTIIRHVYSKKPYKVPDSSMLIWRFMDYTKFVSLLSSKSLFFSRADKFDDPFEGAKGLEVNKVQWDKYYLNFFEEAYRNPPEGHVNQKTDLEIKLEAKRLLSDMNDIGRNDVKRTFINCWHENEVESEAMWKLYTKNMSEGIVIQTTFERLYRALNRNPDISIGRVNYIDYGTRFTGINEAFWYKRKSFEHEREVRALIKNYDKQEDGLAIPVNINILIENIYASPTAEGWFIELLKDTLKKYQLKKSIKLSNLLSRPFH